MRNYFFNNNIFDILSQIAWSTFAVYLIFSVLLIFSVWRIAEKAGYRGWHAIVPFYNAWIFIRIAGFWRWTFIFALIPGVNILFFMILTVGMTYKFDKAWWFCVLTFFLPFIFLPITAIDNSVYQITPDVPIKELEHPLE